MALDLDQLYKMIGKDKYDEIGRFAQDLKRQGKSPDEIAEAVAAKYPEVVRSMIVFTLIPPIMILKGPAPP